MNKSEIINVLCKSFSGLDTIVQYSKKDGFSMNGSPIPESDIEGIYVPLMQELKSTDPNNPSKENIDKIVSLFCITPIAFKKYLSLL